MIVGVAIAGLVFVALVVYSAESDRRNAKTPGGRSSRGIGRFLGRRDNDGLLVPPDDLESEPASRTPDSYPDHTQAFDLLHQSKELDVLLSYTPSQKRPAAWNVFWILLGVVLVFLAAAGGVGSTAACVLVLLGAIPLVTGVSDLLKFESSPLDRLPAVVVDKVEKRYAGLDLMGGGVILRACIETRDGDIQYYHVGLRLFRQIEREDIGVAYVRGGHMLDFKKVTLEEA
jgi:hypothetical protein